MIERLEILEGNLCSRYLDLFKNLEKSDASLKSKIYTFDYIYNENTYTDEFKKFTDSILESETALRHREFSMYNSMLLSSSFEIKTIKFKYKNPIKTIPLHELEHRIFPVHHMAILITKIPLLNEGDVRNCLTYLFSGYCGNSFIGGDVDFSKKECIEMLASSCGINDTQQNISYKYPSLKSLMGNVFFTYGGFDYGQFVIANF
jgi:hypothetical protein